MIRHKTQTGYTIIETMISVSLFLVVVTSGMGALLNANVLHRKSQDMRSIMDNLSFIMDDMSRNIRTGYSYRCYPVSLGESLVPGAALDTPRDCTDGWAVVFGVVDEADKWAYYLSSDGKIYKSIDGANTFIPLTPEEVYIEPESHFVVYGAPGISTDTVQPYVSIYLVGKITTKNVETPFSIQTSLSQRFLDI